MGRDRLRVGPELSPGVLSSERQRGDKIEHGRLAKLEDGRPLPEGAEFICVGEPDTEGWRDVRVLYKHERPAEDSTSDEPLECPPNMRGPAQVATRAYCEGYERIFGTRKVGLA